MGLRPPQGEAKKANVMPGMRGRSGCAGRANGDERRRFSEGYGRRNEGAEPAVIGSPRMGVVEINDSKSYRSASTRRKTKRITKHSWARASPTPPPVLFGSPREVPLEKTPSWSSRPARLAQQTCWRPPVYEQKIKSGDARFRLHPTSSHLQRFAFVALNLHILGRFN